MSEWLTGKHAVAEVLAAGRRSVRQVLVLRDARRAEGERIRELAEAAGVALRAVDTAELAAIVGEETGAAARCEPYPYLSAEELPAVGPSEDDLVVVLDQIQDPQNLGAIARTAEAAGATALCIPTRRAAQVTPAVVRASAGATEHLRIHRITNVARTLGRLKESGYWIVGLDPEGEQPWHRVDYLGGVALVVGAEGHGLRRLVAERCDHRVALRMRGRVASLNASAAFAAVAFEVVRQQSGGR